MSPAKVVSTCLGFTLILGGAACIPKAEIEGFHDSGATVADAAFETDGSGRALPDASSMGDVPANDTQTGPDTICVPDCTDRECGDDGCQGSCGSCDDLVDCSGGACECVNGICGCLPECGSRECGSDGCGGVCGNCQGQDRCSDDGICECEPDCGTSECGDDGCGGSCGDCIGMAVLCVEGSCVCQPDCSFRDCGDDGCQGSCGSCNVATHYCGPAQTCLPNSDEFCDEIDISKIVGWSLPASWPDQHKHITEFTKVLELESMSLAAYGMLSWNFSEPMTWQGDTEYVGMVVSCYAENGDWKCFPWDYATTSHLSNGGRTLSKISDVPPGKISAYAVISFEFSGYSRTNFKRVYWEPDQVDAGHNSCLREPAHVVCTVGDTSAETMACE